jgi:hypothetical protein
VPPYDARTKWRERLGNICPDHVKAETRVSTVRFTPLVLVSEWLEAPFYFLTVNELYCSTGKLISVGQ